MSARILLSVALGVIGCATPCEQHCEAESECPSAPEVDCSAQCTDSESLADAAGCRAELDAATTCEVDAPDACTSRETCKDAVDAYNACFDQACIENPALCGE